MACSPTVAMTSILMQEVTFYHLAVQNGHNL